MTLRRWLVDHEITAARTTAPVPVSMLVGDRVAGVDTNGKHLMIRFASGRVLHTHMRMTGSWHVYAAGAHWHRPAHHARLVLEAGPRVAVCFSAPVIELLGPGGDRAHPVLTALGPDVLAEPLDIAAITSRASLRPGTTEIGDLLLDQRVVAGIGNIWRSEALFLTGVHPRQHAADVDVGATVAAAARLMRESVAGHAGQRWVYGRAGRPCRRCGARIESARAGTQARALYWCPRCQPARFAAPG